MKWIRVKQKEKETWKQNWFLTLQLERYFLFNFVPLETGSSSVSNVSFYWTNQTQRNGIFAACTRNVLLTLFQAPEAEQRIAVTLTSFLNNVQTNWHFSDSPLTELQGKLFHSAFQEGNHFSISNSLWLSRVHCYCLWQQQYKDSTLN